MTVSPIGNPGKVRVFAVRALAVVVALTPAWYVVPRFVALVRVPDVLDDAIGHAQSYNKRVFEIAALNEQTRNELAALGRVDAALVGLQPADQALAGRLRAVVDQIWADVLPLLGRTDTAGTALVRSLDRLSAALAAVREPVDGTAAGTVDGPHGINRALRTAREVADQVRAARESAGRAVDNHSRPGR